MKKNLKFLFVFSLIFTLSFGSFFEGIALAVPPTDGGVGDASKIGKINCVYKHATGEFAPGVWQMSVLIGTDKFFYVKEGATAPSVKNTTSATDLASHPMLTYKSGSLTNRIFFSYQTPTGGDGSTASDRNLTLNPFLQMTGATNIYTSTSDGEKYYPFDFSKLNDTNMPVCTGAVRSITPASCTDGIKNQDETGIDTGGICAVGLGYTGVGVSNCTAPTLLQLGTCADGIKNGNETDIDVGGSCGMGGIIGEAAAGVYTPPIEHIKGVSTPRLISFRNVNLPASWQPYLEQTKNDWNLARGVSISLGGAGYTIPITYASFSENWIGAASYYKVGVHQYNSSVEINERMMNQLNLNNPAYIKFLLMHELGHAIGLGHSDENNYNSNTGSPMDYSRHPEGGVSGYGLLSNLNPIQKEIDLLNCIYNHSDQN